MQWDGLGVRPIFFEGLPTCAGSAPGVEGFSAIEVGDEPFHDALPAFGVVGRSGGIVAETFLADS